MTKILIKRLSKNAVIPKYETPGASGMDLIACIEKDVNIKPGNKAVIPVGFALSVPKDFEIQIRPRSGLAAKNDITVLNTPGTIDSDYRGEVKVILFNHGKNIFKIEHGLRIAQMILCPVEKAEIIEVEELTETLRGKGGFGSTGHL